MFDTCMVEDDDVFGASCTNLTVFLNLSGCSSCAVSDPLLPMWMFLIRFSSCCFSSSPHATACRSAICSSLLGFHRHIPRASLNSSSFPLFHSLCLGDSCPCVHSSLLFHVKVLSIIVLIRSRHSLLCGLLLLHAMPALHTPGQPPVLPWASMSADNTWNLLGSDS